MILLEEGRVFVGRQGQQSLSFPILIFIVIFLHISWYLIILEEFGVPLVGLIGHFLIHPMRIRDSDHLTLPPPRPHWGIPKWVFTAAASRPIEIRRLSLQERSSLLFLVFF